MSSRVFACLPILGMLAASGASAADLPAKAPAADVAPPFFIVNDNSLSYHYEFTATNPGTGYTPKNVLTYTHFDVWKYGTNFVNIDWLKATNGAQAPAAPCGFPNANVGCEGYTEIFGIVRSTIGWNQLTDSKMFSVGALTNISFLVGADLNTDNTNLGSAKRSIEAGLQFDFATPYKGFFNVGVVAYKEWQHDGIAASLGTNPSGRVDFNTTWGIELNYVQPLGFLPPSIPLTYKALVTIRGPKGAGEPGAAPRTTEYFTQQLLSLDVGQIVNGKPNVVSVWGGYRWWKNKFGLDPVPSGLCCTVESTWLVGSTWTF
ncbi:MAG: hypothetical protein WBD48_03655 [Pseudolabrys sp.]